MALLMSGRPAPTGPVILASVAGRLEARPPGDGRGDQENGAVPPSAAPAPAAQAGPDPSAHRVRQSDVVAHHECLISSAQVRRAMRMGPPRSTPCTGPPCVPAFHAGRQRCALSRVAGRLPAPPASSRTCLIRSPVSLSFAEGPQRRADYVLYVDQRAAGVIEAKPEVGPLSGVEWQSRDVRRGVAARVRLACAHQRRAPPVRVSRPPARRPTSPTASTRSREPGGSSPSRDLLFFDKRAGARSSRGPSDYGSTTCAPTRHFTFKQNPLRRQHLQDFVDC